MTLFKCSTLILFMLLLATLIGFTSGLKCHYCKKKVGGEDTCKDNFGGEAKEHVHYRGPMVCYREETTSPEGKSLLLSAQKIEVMGRDGIGCHDVKPGRLRICYCNTDGCNPAIKLGVNIFIFGMAFLSAFSNFFIGDRIGLIM